MSDPHDAEYGNLADAIFRGSAEDTVQLTQDLLGSGRGAMQVLQNGLMVGMARVGMAFKDDELFLTEVMAAASAMQAGMSVLRPLLKGRERMQLGTLVIGTVEGDLHDIGKDLVKIVMEAAGIQVIDLGINTPATDFVEAVRKRQPKIVGMSALLTTTMGAMAAVVRALDEAGYRDRVKILIGGAPVTQAFADKIRADGYAPDAMSAVEVAKQWLGQ